jgi:hypothetical protein
MPDAGRHDCPSVFKAKTMIMSQLRVANLKWRRAWCIAIGIWLIGCVLVTAYRFPTEAKLRAAWAAASYQTLFRDRQAIDAADAECQKLSSASAYSASMICIDDVLHMKNAYQDRLNSLTAYGEKQARQERLPDQLFTVAEGIALWAVPSFGLYLVGWGIRRLAKSAEKPLHRPAEQAVARDVFRWPDRTRRKPIVPSRLP